MTIEISNGPPPPIRLNPQCWKTDCTTKPEFQVGMILVGELNGARYPIECQSGVTVCREHKPEITVEYMVTDEGWKMICDGFRLAKKLVPTRSLTKLRFLPILHLGGSA